MIQQIPAFIKWVYSQKQITSPIGKFHPGLIYDMNIWQNNPNCQVYSCQEQYPERVTIKDAEGNQRKAIRKKNYEVFFIVTPMHILSLRNDNTRNRNACKLNGWATLHAIEKVKHGIQDEESVTIQMRQFSADIQPWVLNLRMRNNMSKECVQNLTKTLKD